MKDFIVKLLLKLNPVDDSGEIKYDSGRDLKEIFMKMLLESYLPRQRLCSIIAPHAIKRKIAFVIYNCYSDGQNQN